MDLSTRNTEISPRALKKRLDAGENIAILDIREPHERQICKLSDTIHIPMADLPTRIGELNSWKDKELVVYCRSGGRSAHSANFLRTQGFQCVLNLEGGVLAWSDEVDPSMPKY